MTAGTRVTAVDIEHPDANESTVIVNDYVLITDGSAQMTRVQRYSNGTHVITVKGVKR